MACHTPFDTCSICGNKARSRNEYCSHLRNELGRILANGQKVMAINDGPLRFFDMSFVFKPADITSSVLQKVAYENSNYKSNNSDYIKNKFGIYGGVDSFSSIENAQAFGLVEKMLRLKS